MKTKYLILANLFAKLKASENLNREDRMKKKILLSIATLSLLLFTACSEEKNMQTTEKENKLALSEEWDKVFPQSDKVIHSKVTFRNRYGIPLAADLYIPKKGTGKWRAVAVSGPFGAVKEQASGFYAQTLAENGFLTLAFDPSFTGESGGDVRNVASPDINTEDFSAAVDYLVNRDDVDSSKVGILGICGFGGIGINAAAMDTRIKATVASTSYDMTRVTANGYNDVNDNVDARQKMLESLNAQRSKDFAQGFYDRAGGNQKPEEQTEQTPQFLKDYSNYYMTKRGFHARSVNSVGGWNKTSSLPFVNMPFLQRIGEIRNPVLLIHGEKAHSRYFSETMFQNMQKGHFPENKELLIVPGANHVDLYDNAEKIPFARIVEFFGRM